MDRYWIGTQMEIATKIDMLLEIYEVYDDFSRGLTMACRRGCATCCTQNVTMTTLEGYCILLRLISSGNTDLLKAVHHTAENRRFQPTISTNELAALCLRREDPQEEPSDWSPGACPFLHRGECLIYQERPFGCRCFFSTQVCKSVACAVVDPFLITVNTVFLQFIEQIDTGGVFGNMNDVLLFLEPEARRSRYQARGALDNPDHVDHPDRPEHLGGLARNRPIPALLVPPGHQQRLQPLLKKLGKIEMQHVRLGGQRR